MAADKKIAKLPIPYKGMETMSFKAVESEKAAVMCGMMVTKDERLKRSPGNRLYKAGFSAKAFYGLHNYEGRNLCVNNGQIVEFNGNSLTNRKAVNATKNMGFLNAQGACFAWNSDNNYKAVGEVWENWGLKGPEEAPTLAEAAGGSLAAGTYLIAVSYVVVEDSARVIVTASEFGTASIAIAGTSRKINLTNIPIPPAKFTHKIIWCTAINGSVLYEYSIIAASVTTASILVAPTSGVEYEDYQNNYGIDGTVKWANYNEFSNAIWIIENNTPNTLKRSNVGLHYDFDSFPIGNVVKFPKDLTFCTSLNGVQYAFAEDSVWKLQNSSIDDDPVLVNGSVGTKRPFSWVYFRDGMIGISNRGVEFFDGFKFWEISTGISNLFKNNTYESRGIIYEDSVFGSCYYSSAHLQAEGMDEIRDYLPGGIPLGTGLGSPSDTFDNDSLNTTRWDYVTGNATITEQNSRLELAKSDASVEDVYIGAKASFGAAIMAEVRAVVYSRSATLDELTQYIKLIYNATNYVQIGFKTDGADYSIESKVCIAGVVTTNTETTTLADTKFRIKLCNGKAQTLYKTALGAWEVLGNVDVPTWLETGWGLRLGLDATTADAYAGYFYDLRIQCFTATGLELITPESFDTDKANCSLVAQLDTWKPDVYDKDGVEKQPVWSIMPNRAQQFMILNSGELIYTDYYKEGIYVHDNNEITYDGEAIPCTVVLFPFDGGSGRRQKFCTAVTITGDWENSYKVKLVSWPTKYGQEKTIAGFTRAGMVQPSKTVWVEVKFRKFLGNSVQFIFNKLDFDADFILEKIEPTFTIVRDK